MPASPTRRTQAERRDATIGALLDATIASLAERGYAATSTAAICARAGVSQGALFRHFKTRQELFVAAAARSAEINVEVARTAFSGEVRDVGGVTATLGRLREVVLSPTNQTWRELLVAARSDADLREALRPARLDFQLRMLGLATDQWGDVLPPAEIPALLSLVVNVFDGWAFSAPGTDPTAAPGRTQQAAIDLLAQMIVTRYGQEAR
ncbi:TetR/AcrR family transcriptional regulator [Nocardioides sambongensis]|uniref:TetR/AcrR family transcriptional regulator n=1 Tax=Nocardioides sambongensis TaxID=2589074 RepID=UPI0015E84E87|nr:TetR/AcrR family transcriptional regulator [Nocardioides sambongensis]